MPPTGARVIAALMHRATWQVFVLPLGHPVSTVMTAYIECLTLVVSATVIQRHYLTITPADRYPQRVPEDRLRYEPGEARVGSGKREAFERIVAALRPRHGVGLLTEADTYYDIGLAPGEPFRTV